MMDTNPSVNPPYGVGNCPTMCFPLPPPHPLLPVQPISYVASHVHSPQLPKKFESLAIEPRPRKKQWPTILVSSNSCGTSSYTVKYIMRNYSLWYLSHNHKESKPKETCLKL
jgi:hypothetical protein